MDAFHNEHLQCPRHTLASFVPILSTHHQLGNQRIIIRRNCSLLISGGINTHSRPPGRMKRGNFPRRGSEFLRMLRVDAALDVVPAMHHLPLQYILHLRARRDHNLAFDQIHVGHHLRDRMLHLYARIHLDEMQLLVLVHQKFDRACVPVAHRAQRLAEHISDFVPQLHADLQRRRFLQQLLMPPLNGAFALSQAHHVAMLVGKNLEFDVPGMLHVFFHVEIPIAECGRGFLLRLAVKRNQIFFRPHDAHAASAAASRGFNDDRIAHLPRPLPRFLLRRNYPIRPRQDRHPVLLHRGARLFFLPHQADHLGRRSNKLQAAGFANLGKIRIFGKQSIAGMDGIGIGNLRRADHRRDIEIAQSQLWRPDADSFVGKAHGQ